ncbi:MAG TPA: VOC family protein [Bacteroidales bacterium]|nr:VOC family protein [Bacteroidales bacterium]
MKKLLLICFVVFSALNLLGQIERPPVWGIARMTFLASDFNMARNYYGRFLGFREAFTYDSPSGKVLCFRINDRQFLEFVEDPQTSAKNRLVFVSLETDVVKMLDYLRSKGIEVPANLSDDGAGNQVFSIHDHSGNRIEFITYSDKGLHTRLRGLPVSDSAISQRIHHVGLYSKEIRDDDPLYAQILNFPVILRYPEDKKLSPTLIYFSTGDGTESIEEYAPNDENFSHPCFVVQDMQRTLDILRSRKPGQPLARPAIGKGRRWILNLQNPDGTKVEFTEPFTVK